jgi:hypothetical protein
MLLGTGATTIYRICYNQLALANAIHVTMVAINESYGDNTTCVKLEEAILNTALEENMRALFDGLVNHLEDSSLRFDDGTDGVASFERFNEHIQRLVSEYPILARVVVTRGIMSRRSLLAVACRHQNRMLSHKVIKFFIGMNPSALLWKQSPRVECSSPIYTIARNRAHCVLMPWIAEHFRWALHHPVVLDRPPSLKFVELFPNGSCDASIIQQFFGIYPQGLSQEDTDGMPLHKILTGRRECDADFFKWMAEQRPSSISHQIHWQFTSLHIACLALLSYSTDNTSEICRYLIRKCPVLVRMANKDDHLPIHILIRRCNRRIVQEVVLLLLQEYPESYDMPTHMHHSEPRRVHFVQKVKPFVDQQSELTSNMRDLKGESQNMAAVSASSKNSLFASVSEVLKSWSTTRLYLMEEKLHHVSTKIRRTCEEFEHGDGEGERREANLHQDSLEEYEHDDYESAEEDESDIEEEREGMLGRVDLT